MRQQGRGEEMGRTLGALSYLAQGFLHKLRGGCNCPFLPSKKLVQDPQDH